jgi:hypothetical protein
MLEAQSLIEISDELFSLHRTVHVNSESKVKVVSALN